MARGLSVELVVAAAIELADEAGLAAVTMAAVAKRCGFTTMSLYRHVASKDELVRRMLDDGARHRARVRIGRTGAPGWSSWSRAMLALLDGHPWGIDVPITGMLGTHAQLSWLDRGLEALADTGLDDGAKAEIVLLLNGYVFWSARLRFQVPEEAPRAVIPRGVRPRRATRRWRARVAAGIFEDGIDARRTTSRSASSGCWTASGR